MYRIDDPSAAASLPTPEAAGTGGYWTEGNPGSGVPATLLRASWLNMIQEEIRNVVVAGGLTPSKTTYNQLLTAIQALTGGRLLNIQVFTGNGTYTPTPGTKSIIVEAVGGGGGSGGVPATGSGSSGVSGAGSSGAYAKAYLTSGFSGAAVTIGPAGGAGASSGGSGGNGGTTSFGALLSCPGGLGSSYGASGSGALSLPGASAPPNASGSGIVASSVGAANMSAMQSAGGYATGLSAPPSPMPGTFKGQGGNGVFAGSSLPASAGNPGNSGLVIVYEYA